MRLKQSVPYTEIPMLEKCCVRHGPEVRYTFSCPVCKLPHSMYVSSIDFVNINSCACIYIYYTLEFDTLFTMLFSVCVSIGFPSQGLILPISYGQI